MGLTFLSPLGLLLALAAAVPLGALVLAERRAARVGRLLRLTRPSRRRRAEVAVALSAVTVLLALAAAQPAIGSSQEIHVDEDAQAMFVFDVSGSMAAAAASHAPTRLEQAKRLALQVRAQLGSVQAGAASLTLRVLPYVFPTADEGVFDTTVAQCVHIKSPSPGTPSFAQILEGTRLASDLTSLGTLPTQGYFSPRVEHRLVIVFSDGESGPVSTTSLSAVYHLVPATRMIFVRMGSARDRIFRPDGTPDPRYRPDPRSTAAIRSLQTATGATVLGDGDAGAIIRAARASLHGGRVVTQSLKQTHRPLAAWFAAAAVLPLLLVLRRRNL
jgi:hypothetical protein